MKIGVTVPLVNQLSSLSVNLQKNSPATSDQSSSVVPSHQSSSVDSLIHNSPGTTPSHQSSSYQSGAATPLHLIRSVTPSHIPLDKSLIQVVASKKEIDRRIAAFCKRKRDELDKANQLEFCNVKEGMVESCARVMAMVYRKEGSKSHLRTTCVENAIDSPNCETSRHYGKVEVKQIKLEPDSSFLPVPLENRISELEEKVVFRDNKPVPSDIYSRLKLLEDRLELLEGISPEYCHPVQVVKKKEQQETKEKKEIRKYQVKESLAELDLRIYNLRNLLSSHIIKSEETSD